MNDTLDDIMEEENDEKGTVLYCSLPFPSSISEFLFLPSLPFFFFHSPPFLPSFLLFFPSPLLLPLLPPSHLSLFPFAESDEIINQVLDEIGINLTSQLADTPLAATPATVTAAPAAPQKIAQPAEADLELQARLDKLKKS